MFCSRKLYFKKLYNILSNVDTEIDDNKETNIQDYYLL